MDKGKLSGLMEDLEHAPRVEVRRNRFGYEIDGQYLRRVTTLLKGIPKQWMGAWVAKTVAEFAYDQRDSWWALDRTNAIKLLKNVPWSKRDDAGDRGTAVHNALEAFGRSRELPEMTDEERAYFDAAYEFLQQRDSRPLSIELTVFSQKHGYAGTLDWWDLYDGLSWILDWKTSSGIYAEHAVQQTAYMHAEFAVVQKKQVGAERWEGLVIPWGPDLIDRIGLVHVQPSGATLHEIRDDVVPDLWNVFRAAAYMKHWLSDVDSYGGKTPKVEIFHDPIEPDRGERG